ncbi:MAG TPA: S41 family peptidase [Mucilaginibacter sp.]|jgi:hypothetical protein|nr:S41 family peptidase [Mucilaginibacter sp.]
MKIHKLISLVAFAGAVVTTRAQTNSLSPKIKTEVIENINKDLRELYVFPDTAMKMGDYLRHQLNIHAYDTIKTPSVFAAKITSDLRSVYPDGHLSIEYSAPQSGGDQKPDPAAAKARRLKFIRSVNYGFERAEILQGNTGYIKIKGFAPTDSAGKAMAQTALRFVSNSNALIIDVRDNMGGNPDMVSYLCGFFFAERVHLNDLYTRKDHSTQTFWTTPDTILNSLKSIPLYVLTSHRTFSAGEEFTYDLQTQKRAIVIGETTGGGAHPVGPNDAGHGFTANIPFARAINPVTKTNWEKIGVKPDVETNAGDALNEALKRIAHKQ